MHKIPYDATRESLYSPGEATNFFRLFDAPSTTLAPEILCAEMARLAYVKQENRLKKYLEIGDFTLYWHIGYEKGRGTQVFIALDKFNNNGPQQAIISFRGTECDDPSDLIADINLLKQPWYDFNHKQIGQVHTGFSSAIIADPSHSNILSQLKNQIDLLTITYPNLNNIYITGHSLGAALATLCTSCFIPAYPDKNIHLYTYGSPRVGDCDFVKSIAVDKHDRYVNCCDLITRIPPSGGLQDYQHNGNLYYIESNGVVNKEIKSEENISGRLAASEDYIKKFSFLLKTVWMRELADHSPINYISGVSGLRI